MHRFHNKANWPQMPTVARLRNSDKKDDPAENLEALGAGGAMIQKDPVSLNLNGRGFPPHIHIEGLAEFDVNATEFSH